MFKNDLTDFKNTNGKDVVSRQVLGCALAMPACLWQLIFVFGRQEKLKTAFSLTAGHPEFYSRTPFGLPIRITCRAQPQSHFVLYFVADHLMINTSCN